MADCSDLVASYLREHRGVYKLQNNLIRVSMMEGRFSFGENGPSVMGSE
jgi:hypothetical protein